ncbi:NADH dehydrogenase subunit D; NADH dehydrogenase subunit C [Desulfobulbus propionicus DSM 2032]|jgi:NADH-quinone oxidoreductase subunit C/D|uniref:NADH dehydrogenase subunit D NADH dehydrogenase subunit C n=1 Tax=Desulfobulbus propionicus (strain ATCC 33891 / DSM 2032 / VKM B-1956 / 1pr3) TaxID=577650 RepID=A0A7U3YMP4_DESPD|nr:NADH-quinone oxidoreductase subunit D [Desulfobulbus propionicus]ADW18208.1 NADH dehydrogenase subunit D; NADH dehydrogenase subunit C [Desulfobulbus propionicus DSM 2032]
MNTTALELIQAAFPEAPCTATIDSVVLTVQPEYLEKTLSRLKNDPTLNFSLLLDVTAVDYLNYPEWHEARFFVVYTLRNWEQNRLVQVRVPVADPEVGIPTATGLWDSANWGERETYDQYGIVFQGHPDLRRILNHWQFQGHPLRKDYPIEQGQICYESDSLEKEIKARLQQNGVDQTLMEDIHTEIMYLNLGPSHPATHGAIRILTALDGETILANVNEIGYLHRGFEKTAENRTYNQVIPLTDRLNYCSALMNNIAYAKAVESWLGIDITERAKFMRVILAEFFRVQDHLVCIAANLVDMGGLTNYWYLYNEKEASYDFISRLTGARLTSSFTRIGGMYRDFYEGWEADMEKQLCDIEKGVNDSLKLVLKNRIVHDRTQNVCVMPADKALSYGFTGPCLRASGVPFDLRKDNPYYHYDAFDFTIPLGSKGDIYDRIMIRYEEIFQSISIIRQAMKMIPAGSVNISNNNVFLPPKTEVYSNIEGLASHFKLVFEGVKAPAGEWYDSFEAANGELGFYFVSDGSGKPYKCKVRPPCFYMMGGFHEMVEGEMIADAVINLGSINIIGGELDR